MGKSIVGVDIGTEWIRAIEIQGGRSNKPTVIRWMQVAVPEGAVKNGEVVETNTVATVLKNLWTSAGFKSKEVVLGVGNPKVLVRDLTVARQSRNDIRMSLPFQVQEMLPVPVTEALLDFYPVTEGVGESGPVVSGLLVAAVKDSVLANVKAVQLAGLTPVEVDIIPFALNRVLVRTEHGTGTVALIDIGAATTNVAITTQGVPQFVRIIPVGGSDVTKALAGRLGITKEQAEVGKRQLGFMPKALHPEHEEAAAIVRELTSELLNSLRNTLSFFVNAHQGQRIDRIVLSGGGAAMTNLADALSELTRIPVITADPLSAFSIGRNASRSDRGHGMNMSIALGLALGSAA